MSDIKYISFIMLLVLVTISAFYTWVEDQPVLGKHIGYAPSDEFSAATLKENLSSLNTMAGDLIQSTLQLDPLGFLRSLWGSFNSVFGIFLKLAFGWEDLIRSIFLGIGLDDTDPTTLDLSDFFIVPLVLIQLLGGFYFLRDLVNTIRGVG